jgi:hypothetical protein
LNLGDRPDVLRIENGKAVETHKTLMKQSRNSLSFCVAACFQGPPYNHAAVRFNAAALLLGKDGRGKRT